MTPSHVLVRLATLAMEPIVCHVMWVLLNLLLVIPVVKHAKYVTLMPIRVEFALWHLPLTLLHVLVTWDTLVMALIANHV